MPFDNVRSEGFVFERAIRTRTIFRIPEREYAPVFFFSAVGETPPLFRSFEISDEARECAGVAIANALLCRRIACQKFRRPGLPAQARASGTMIVVSSYLT
jgi:hypothetical protein